ncbi:lytic transglycosylase domain-containing protein [Notoacmeibacter marinus]|uniref:transglycosylase SLT domain-containing protein n=1 Tax=Notoacmeibacter marinus TaxID=1876515 RepID=UPI00196408AB|nr:lytic transglycosylase domain-containing protein [Notoacmeibacter marinus]
MMRETLVAALLSAVLLGCTTNTARQSSPGMSPRAAEAPPALADNASGRDSLEPLIAYYAAKHNIPESLLHRVVTRESRYRPKARNGPYWGLMQIRHDTARTMGYRGSASGLLDPATNMEYAGRYLRGAWLLANGSEKRAVRLYASGYYYVAKRRGMLCETGLRRCRDKD